MTDIDHLALAKDYIARGEDFYRKAADEIKAAMTADTTLSYREIGRSIGKSDRWCRDIVQWSTTAEGPPTPYGGSEQNEARYERHDKTVLRDPERLTKVAAEMDTPELEAAADKMLAVAAERRHAQSREIDTEPRVRDLTDASDPFRPDEHWADGPILRVSESAAKLSALVSRAGMTFGAMTPEKALDYLKVAEHQIADVRAAAQELVNDRAEVA